MIDGIMYGISVFVGIIAGIGVTIGVDHHKSKKQNAMIAVNAETVARCIKEASRQKILTGMHNI